MDSAYQKNLYRYSGHHSMTIEKTDFYCVHGRHLGFMQIVGVAKKFRSGNEARFVLEHIFITNQQKTSLYSTFLGSENFKWTPADKDKFNEITLDFTGAYVTPFKLTWAEGDVLIEWDSSRRSSIRASVCASTLSNMNISKTSWLIKIKFHLEHYWGGERLH